jgi:hypothetical protein
MWENVVKPESPKTILRLRVACWISKAIRAQAYIHVRGRTHTHTEICNALAFPQQKWFRKRVSMLRYTYIVCLVMDISCTKMYQRISKTAENGAQIN